MDIAIISDTHLPRGQRRLPDSCIERLAAADLIIHAGDFVTAAVLDEVKSYGEVEAVQGNMDDGQLRRLLPHTLVIDAGPLKLGVVHNGGPRVGRPERMRKRFPEAAAVIFGHSHTPLHEIGDDGFQIFNPGSPTDKRRAPSHTMGLATSRHGAIGFELIQLD